MELRHLHRPSNGCSRCARCGHVPFRWLHSRGCLQYGNWLAMRNVGLSCRVPFETAKSSNRLNKRLVLECDSTFSVSLVSKTNPNNLTIERDDYPLAFPRPPRPVTRPTWPPPRPLRSPRLPLISRPLRKVSSPV